MADLRNHLCRSLGVLFLLASVGAAEPQPELRMLNGDVHTGKLLSVGTAGIAIEKGTQRFQAPVEQVLSLDLNKPEKLPDAAFFDLEFTDGTVVHCSTYSIKEKTVLATLLLTGQKIEMPLGSLSNVLANAQNEKYRHHWSDLLKKKGQKDVLAKIRGDVINPFPGLLGAGNADGTAIAFTPDIISKESTVPLKDVHGLIFKRDVDPAAKPPICKLIDTYRNTIMIREIEQTADSISVTTPAGLKLNYPLKKVVMLDYSQGKLVYLSDLTPGTIAEVSTDDRVFHFMRNQNLDGKPTIKVKGESYTKGLALHADCRLGYDLNGDFTVFKAFAGFDDDVGGIAGPVTLRIEGDGKKLYEVTLDRRTWSKTDKPKIELNIKDVQSLTIDVSTSDLLTLGKHLVLVDAKLTKQ